MGLSTYFFCIPHHGVVIAIFVFMCTFCILGYAKMACAVFAQSEIFDMLVEWYSTQGLSFNYFGSYSYNMPLLLGAHAFPETLIKSINRTADRVRTKKR